MAAVRRLHQFKDVRGPADFHPVARLHGLPHLAVPEQGDGEHQAFFHCKCAGEHLLGPAGGEFVQGDCREEPQASQVDPEAGDYLPNRWVEEFDEPSSFSLHFSYLLPGQNIQKYDSTKLVGKSISNTTLTCSYKSLKPFSVNILTQAATTVGS
jgi:hypothetical protein